MDIHPDDVSRIYVASLVTPRLVLRTPTVDDLSSYLAYRNEPASLASQMIEAASEDDARSFLYAQSQLGDFAPGWRMFSLERHGSRGLIGEVGVFIAEADPQQGDIGWWLHSDHRKQGYAVEAASRLVEWCFVERGLHRVTASCLSRNTASRSTMHRIGMRLERQSVESRLCAGHWQDEVGYALLKREWLSIRHKDLPAAQLRGR